MPAGANTSSPEPHRLLRAYLSERVAPHPILGEVLPAAAAALTGGAAYGEWDERSPLEVRLLLPDELHEPLASRLREAGLWSPSRDFRLLLPDREPFRRYPGAELQILSAGQFRQELAFHGPAALWEARRAVVVQDPASLWEGTARSAADEFDRRLSDLRCEHYYRFRQARSELRPPLSPRRQTVLWAIERGEASREALRLAFLADGLPFPPDRWLELFAETDTRFGPGIVTAVRALVASREPHTVEHASKVLRDRVAVALLQAGVHERWLEQWWLWPYIAPVR